MIGHVGISSDQIFGSGRVGRSIFTRHNLFLTKLEIAVLCSGDVLRYLTAVHFSTPLESHQVSRGGANTLAAAFAGVQPSVRQKHSGSSCACAGVKPSVRHK